MSQPVYIFDFDGILTDAEAEGAPFTSGYLDDLSALTDIYRPVIEQLATRFAAEISPNDGWIFDRQTVAPACVDPYLRIMPVAHAILTLYRAFMDPLDRARLLGVLHRHNYEKSATVFRTATMNPMNWLVERIIGSAQKYVNDPQWQRVPDLMWIDNLARPVLLRRRLYFKTLESLRTKAQAKWKDVTVVGNIFELELALPLALGARVVLMGNEHTPLYEIAYLARHPRANIARSIPELRELLGI